MLNRQNTVWQILIPAVSIPVTTLPRVATTIKCSVQRPVKKQDVFRVKNSDKESLLEVTQVRSSHNDFLSNCLT